MLKKKRKKKCNVYLVSSLSGNMTLHLCTFPISRSIICYFVAPRGSGSSTGLKNPPFACKVCKFSDRWRTPKTTSAGDEFNSNKVWWHSVTDGAPVIYRLCSRRTSGRILLITLKESLFFFFHGNLSLNPETNRWHFTVFWGEAVFKFGRLLLSVLVAFKTPITVYMKLYKKKTRKNQQKNLWWRLYFLSFLCILFCFFFFLPWLFTALQVEIQFALGKRIKIIYEYIIKNLKYRKMHTHVDSYA